MKSKRSKQEVNTNEEEKYIEIGENGRRQGNLERTEREQIENKDYRSGKN